MLHSKISVPLLLLLGIGSAIADPVPGTNIRFSDNPQGGNQGVNPNNGVAQGKPHENQGVNSNNRMAQGKPHGNQKFHSNIRLAKDKPHQNQGYYSHIRVANDKPHGSQGFQPKIRPTQTKDLDNDNDKRAFHPNIRLAKDKHHAARAVHPNIRLTKEKQQQKGGTHAPLKAGQQGAHAERAVHPDVKVIVGHPEVATQDMEERSDSTEMEETSDSSDAVEERDIADHLGNIHARALSNDASQALNLHNGARAKKYIAALVWDTSLESAALAYAQQLASSGKFAHSDASTRPNQGENLAYAWSSTNVTNPITTGTNGWLSEINNYKGEAIPQGNFSNYGHYTQIMWNTTVKVGIATAYDGKGAWYTVGRYSPPGNYGGQKPY